MKAAHFSEDVREFFVVLGRHDVRYLLVGGEAVIHYGLPRLTGDVDFFFEQTGENADRLFEALRDFWGEPVPGVSGAEDLLQPDLVLQFGRPPNRIDLLASVSAVSFEQAWPSRLVVRLEGVSPTVDVPIIGLDTLIRNKRAAGRPKDLMDVDFLERLLRLRE